MKHDHRDGSGWADSAAFRKSLVAALFVASLAIAAAGFVPAFENPHPHFTGEEMPVPVAALWRQIAPVFPALWGFASFMFIVLAGQHLRTLVGRKEDYYDEHE